MLRIDFFFKQFMSRSCLIKKIRMDMKLGITMPYQIPTCFMKLKHIIKLFIHSAMSNIHCRLTSCCSGSVFSVFGPSICPSACSRTASCLISSLLSGVLLESPGTPATAAMAASSSGLCNTPGGKKYIF